MKIFDSLLNNEYEFPDGARPEEISAAVEPLHRSFFDQQRTQQAPPNMGAMNVGALNQIGTILQQAGPRFPKVDRATAAALGNNFQPYMQARRQDIQAQQQDRRSDKENALREKAMFMQQQRAEMERRDRLAYQQMLMDNNEREEQLALKRFQFESDRATREEQRYQEEQRRSMIPQWKVDESTGIAYSQDPTTGQIMTQVVPEMQAALAARRAGSGSAGGGASSGSMTSMDVERAVRLGMDPWDFKAVMSGTATPEQASALEAAAYRKQVSDAEEERSNRFYKAKSAGMSDAEAAEEANKVSLPQEPPSVAAYRRGRELDANVSARTGNPLSGKAVMSARTDASPEQVAEMVSLGLMNEVDAAAALMSRGLTLPKSGK